MDLFTTGFPSFAGTVGVVLLVMVVIGASQTLPVEELIRQINKLVRADNVERAVKLCDAAPGRPVAQLCRLGLEACREPGVPEDGGVERATMAMTQRLPALQATAMRDAVAAMVLGGLVTAAGGATVLFRVNSLPVALPLVAMAIVDSLAMLCATSRMRMRRDLARAVAAFGRAGAER
jgi:hypothetical protein